MSVLAAAVALADLCGAAPEPAASPDPADSAAYTAVGEDARATGDLRSAAIAYRKAIALDASNQRATAALAALCLGARAADQATDQAADQAAALLGAIARYRAGDHVGAAAALAQLVRTRGTAMAGAHFFLGLIALEHHDAGAAIRELELARTDPAYHGLAAALLRLAHRDGAITAALLVGPEFDTNPQLVPDTPPAGAVTGPPAADEALLAGATVTARPWSWLAVRDTLTWRDQRRSSELDFLGNDVALAAELRRGQHRVAIGYDLDYDLLNTTRYVVANRGTIAYRHDGAIASPVASYALRRRDFLRDTEQPFTGWVHSADGGAIVELGAGLQLDGRATLHRELTADSSFSNLAAGGRLTLRTRSTAPVRLTASAMGSYARYDSPEPDRQLRRDVLLGGSADAEIDLADHVAAVTGVSFTYNQSSIEDFRYSQLIARLGLVVAWGGL